MIPPVTSAFSRSASLASPEPIPKADAFDALMRDSATKMPDGSAQGLANPASFEAHIKGGLAGWQAKLDQMDHLISTTTNVPQAQASSAPDVAGKVLPGAAPIFGLMVQTFNFAMQTQLVARAATQFTGSINTLMKGQ